MKEKVISNNFFDAEVLQDLIGWKLDKATDGADDEGNDLIILTFTNGSGVYRDVSVCSDGNLYISQYYSNVATD